MDLSNVNSIEGLNHEHTAKLVLDMFHRIIIHYALWINEVKLQMGIAFAGNILSTPLWIHVFLIYWTALLLGSPPSF